MKTMFGLGTVIALALAAVACGKAAEPSSSTLEVTGKVDTQLRTLDNASALAIGSDGRTYSAYLQKNGAFRLELPVGNVYRIIFANSTMAGELRTIGHLVNSTSAGKFDEIAVKDGGTLYLGTVRPVGTSASSLKTACNCGSTGSGESSDSDKSDSEADDDDDKSEGNDGDFESKGKDGDEDRLCEDSSDVELEAENGPGDKCAKDSNDKDAPKPSKKSCSSKDDNHDGKDDDDGDGDKAGSDSSSDTSSSSCTCSKQCGAGASCVASKCTPDGSGSADGTSSSSSSSSGFVPPAK
ncbi:MAG: hypothetical protein JWP87_475 [Labilithrix sp.]|nr:hypothetical protein [Labilithrix sp.]